MIYDYKCSACGTEKEVIKFLRDIDRIERCDICRGLMTRQVSKTNITPDYEPWVDDNMNKDGSPVYVKSRRHQKQLLKERRLTQIG